MKVKIKDLKVGECFKFKGICYKIIPRHKYWTLPLTYSIAQHLNSKQVGYIRNNTKVEKLSQPVAEKIPQVKKPARVRARV